MQTPATTDENHKSNGAARKRRISDRVRHAVTLRVEKGLTGEEAAKLAGLSPAGFWKAWKQPHVQNLYSDLKAAYIHRVMDRRELLRAKALIEAERLLEHADSEAVRAKMVEFLAGEARGPAVSVTVNQAPSGYQYRRPLDQASSAIDGQAVDITPEPGKVGQ
jgi:hypothetical protein